ncbi:hypothetical protein P8452_77784 [Trifolium repens]|nr:hypothetical protein P8452_77784 [Trifolium repens]
MGTKIKYSINLLARNKLAVSGVNVWEQYQNKRWLTNKHHRFRINKLQGQIMDKMLDKNNIESIKKTMQMHEDIFKHQVRELHRIYSVQKMLMNELRNKNRQQNFWNPMNDIDKKISRGFDLEKPAIENTFIGSSFGIDEGEVGTSSYTTAFQSCELSTVGDCSNEEMEVDLTLSIGGRQLNKNSNMQ